MEKTKRGGVPLYLWMLLGFAVGLGGGLYVNLNDLVVIPWVMELIQAVGQIFLRLLFMLVIPLLFAALAVLKPLSPLLRGPLSALRPTEAEDVAAAMVALAAARPTGVHTYEPDAIRTWATR